MPQRRWLCVRFFDRVFRRRDVEQASAQVQLQLPMAIGKQAVMTNAVKAVRNGVKQETADELMGIECHYLLPAARSIILPSECDSIAIDADEAGIGDGDAMGIAPEIGQHLFGSGKGRLGIDDPADTPRFFDHAVECGRTGQAGDVAEELKLVQVVGLLQLFKKQPPEQA